MPRRPAHRPPRRTARPLLAALALTLLVLVPGLSAADSPQPTVDRTQLDQSLDALEAQARELLASIEALRDVPLPVTPVDTGPTPAPEPAPEPDPEPGADIYAEHEGFGDPSFTGAQSVVVTSAADSGPGTLRAAVAGDAPKHITFAADMVIQNSSEIPVGSNTLIDGRGHDVVIDGDPGTGGLLIQDEAKVTVAYLTLRNFGTNTSSGTEDAILINNSDDVWLHHLDLSGAADKAVGVQDGSVGVTVSWSHFHDQAQVFQIGNQFGGEVVDAPQTVTVHHNYFDGTGYRHPVISYGRAHVYNNYYRDWANYGARAQRVGQMLFEANVAYGTRDANITEFTTPGNGCNDRGSRCDDRDGYVKLVGNAALPGSIALRWKQNQPGNVFTPPYAYTAETANQALADAIVAGAGPA